MWRIHTSDVSADLLARTQLALERAGDEARSVVALCRAVHDVVDRVIPSDRWCSFAVDPATMFATNGYHDEGIPTELLPRLLELEHGTPDCNHLPALARSRVGVATLAQATHGDPTTSARWRDVLVPSGLEHELRAVFRDGERVWGALILLRAPDVADFTRQETAIVAGLAPVIASGFRRVLVRQQLENADDVREAGILIVAGDPLEIRTTTAAASYWLDQLDDGGYRGSLPTPLMSAVHASRQNPSAPAAVRARTRSGRWVTITAERASGDASDAVGLVVQPSRPAEIATIVGAAHRLTGRESDVVVLVAAGHTNQEIARRLGVSPHTVSDHLKNIFAKLGVSTRGEMTSKLFYDHYLPREVDRLRVGADGWYLPGSHRQVTTATGQVASSGQTREATTSIVNESVGLLHQRSRR